MAKTDWDSRYDTEEFIYGTSPNEFYKMNLLTLTPGRILLPCDGEGRNSIFAAKNGWDVTAFDQSEVAMNKAMNFANKQNVKVNYNVSSVEDFEIENCSFDVIALIYAHFPKENRSNYHKKFIEYLKKDGLLILEAFSKDQINNNSGGPKNIDLLYSIEELEHDFNNMNIQILKKIDMQLLEGEFHSGNATVVRLICQKNY